jgi:hypothetical protein
VDGVWYPRPTASGCAFSPRSTREPARHPASIRWTVSWCDGLVIVSTVAAGFVTAGGQSVAAILGGVLVNLLLFLAAFRL